MGLHDARSCRSSDPSVHRSFPLISAHCIQPSTKILPNVRLVSCQPTAPGPHTMHSHALKRGLTSHSRRPRKIWVRDLVGLLMLSKFIRNLSTKARADDPYNAGEYRSFRAKGSCIEHLLMTTPRAFCEVRLPPIIKTSVLRLISELQSQFNILRLLLDKRYHMGGIDEISNTCHYMAKDLVVLQFAAQMLVSSCCRNRCKSCTLPEDRPREPHWVSPSCEFSTADPLGALPGDLGSKSWINPCRYYNKCTREDFAFLSD